MRKNQRIDIGLTQLLMVGMILAYCSNNWTGKMLGLLLLLLWAISFFAPININKN